MSEYLSFNLLAAVDACKVFFFPGDKSIPRQHACCQVMGCGVKLEPGFVQWGHL